MSNDLEEKLPWLQSHSLYTILGIGESHYNIQSFPVLSAELDTEMSCTIQFVLQQQSMHKIIHSNQTIGRATGTTNFIPTAAQHIFSYLTILYRLNRTVYCSTRPGRPTTSHQFGTAGCKLIMLIEGFDFPKAHILQLHFHHHICNFTEGWLAKELTWVSGMYNKTWINYCSMCFNHINVTWLEMQVKNLLLYSTFTFYIQYILH